MNWTEFPLEIDADTHVLSGGIALPARDAFGAVSDAEFTFRVAWNTRRGTWAFSLYDSAGVALVEGRTISIGFDLLCRCSKPGRPYGRLLPLRVDERGLVDCSHDDLGINVRLYLVPP